ncbi:hypothetical protein [Rhizobium terrae]|uniref:hypothetical protein n=1 Tax=Rhizobium terrae TaxID=2171756 RepID=UPI000E3D58D6|nr:hypothetical protein [Rhizobium terrae]
MANTDGRKDALLIRLQRIEDDIENLSAQAHTPEIAAAIAELISEAGELEAEIARLRSTNTVRDKVKEARALRYKGMSLDDIAEKMGIGKSSVRRYCEDIPIDRRRFASPRLAPPDWLDAAKAMRAEGKTRHVIARELRIPLANFYRAFNRFADG